jgi:HIP---CoA ligase
VKAPEDVDTIAALVADRAKRWRHDPAIVDGGHQITFGDLGVRAATVAGALVERGVNRGDRVAIWAENRYEWIVSALGLHLAGAALVPLNTRFKAREVADILSRSKARVLISTGSFLGVDYPLALDAFATHLPDLTEVYALGPTESPRARPWDELLAGDPGLGWMRGAMVTGEDMCDVLFTSGTTGVPKGAVCTHASTVRASATLAGVVGLRRHDRYLIINPFFHAFGYKAGWLGCLLTGAIAYPMAVFDVTQALRTVERERITVFPGPPTVFWSVLESDEWQDTDLSTLRMTITGSTGVPASLLRRMRDDLGFRDICVGYGLTEANGLGTMCRPADPIDVVANTSGRLIPGMELRFGKDSEILMRGHLMKEYLDDPRATAEAIDNDGWLHTGDIGALDADGNLIVMDRKKDMFVVGGFNVYPAEIEAVLVEHPQVSRAAVIGVADERMGEVGKAFIVPAVVGELDADELLAWCRERMANFKVPRYVTLCTELPVTANGKVRKDALRAGGGAAPTAVSEPRATRSSR